MKTLSILSLWLASCILSLGAGAINGVTYSAWNGVEISSWNGSGVSAAGGGVGGEPTYIVSENFEGAGTPAGGWGMSGTAPFDQSTTGLSLEATECVALIAGAGSTAYTPQSLNLTEINIQWIYRPTEAANGAFFLINNSSFAAVAQIYRLSDGRLSTVHGSAQSAYTVGTVANNTSYYVWFRYVKGTGSNGIAELWFSATSTKPADGSDYHVKTIVGDATTNADFVVWTAVGDTLEHYIDRVRIAATAIP